MVSAGLVLLVAACLAVVSGETATHPLPPKRIHLEPPILTDVFPEGGDNRGSTLITISGHGFKNTKEMDISTEQWKASGGDNFGLFCVFYMSSAANGDKMADGPSPIRVEAKFLDDGSVTCLTPKYKGPEKHIEFTGPMSLSKVPVERRVLVRVTNDGMHISKSAVKYTYGVGDCCDPHQKLGCLNAVIQACVCAHDKQCCDPNINMWDGMCAQTVVTGGCQTKANMCPSDSFAARNTKMFQKRLEVGERTSLQRHLDLPWNELPPKFNKQHFVKWQQATAKLFESPAELKMNKKELHDYYEAAVKDTVDKKPELQEKAPEVKDVEKNIILPESMLSKMLPKSTEPGNFKLPFQNIAHSASNIPKLYTVRKEAYIKSEHQ